MKCPNCGSKKVNSMNGEEFHCRDCGSDWREEASEKEETEA